MYHGPTLLLKDHNLAIAAGYVRDEVKKLIHGNVALAHGIFTLGQNYPACLQCFQLCFLGLVFFKDLNAPAVGH